MTIDEVFVVFTVELGTQSPDVPASELEQLKAELAKLRLDVSKRRVSLQILVTVCGDSGI